MSSTRARSGTRRAVISNLIPLFNAYNSVLAFIYGVASAATGLYPAELTDMAAYAVGLREDAGFADIVVAALSSN